ncbi:MAG: hypothetical protein Q8L34_04805, partial [Candidatus Woesearchaeota archaeon]|nr:hypothetical protein [Candidatus Woesearchaeota archaeon]
QGRSPVHQQILLRRHLLYSQLTAVKTLKEFHFNQPKFVGTDEEQRRKYVVEWSCIERGSNVPVVYRLCLVQANRAPPLEETSHDGLETLAYQTQYGSSNLRQLATHMDRELEDIHPKMLQKFVIGPFYHPLTHNSAALDALIRGEDQNAVLRFNIQSVLSERARKLGKVLGSRKLSQWLGFQTELQLFGPLDDYDQRMLVPFHLKQQLVDKDEEGHPCKIYGVMTGGEIHG